ncbi:MAG: GNAT family N-acetyltransferase [Acidobacteria bacterium]|nr:GNAT family N-acetyltransferase [Acidobacteriota bacterium]
MTSDVLVRPIAHDELRAAAQLVHDGSLSLDVEHPEQTEAYWAAVLETRQRLGEVLVASRGDEVVGVCQLMVFPHFQHTGGWCAELESVHVRSDMRGRGIGAMMLARAEELARERGCYRLQLTSRNVRHDAHRFYVRNGFELTSQGFKKLLVRGDLT